MRIADWDWGEIFGRYKWTLAAGVAALVITGIQASRQTVGQRTVSAALEGTEPGPAADLRAWVGGRRVRHTYVETARYRGRYVRQIEVLVYATKASSLPGCAVLSDDETRLLAFYPERCSAKKSHLALQPPAY